MSSVKWRPFCLGRNVLMSDTHADSLYQSDIFTYRFNMSLTVWRTCPLWSGLMMIVRSNIRQIKFVTDGASGLMCDFVVRLGWISSIKDFS